MKIANKLPKSCRQVKLIRAILLLLFIPLTNALVVAQDETSPRVIPEKFMNVELMPLRRVKPIKLSDFAEKKVLVLAMWATWCGPCLFSMPELNKIERGFSARGVEAFGLSTLSNERGGTQGVRQYVRRRGLKLNFVWTTEETHKFLNTRGILPVTLVVTSDGTIRKEFLGWNPTSTPRLLRSTIESILNESRTTAERLKVKAK